MLRQWLAQRRRWIKGWMQTAVVALPGRAPEALRLSVREQLAVHGVITGGVIGMLLYPLSLFVLFFSISPWADGQLPQGPAGWALIAVNACNLVGVLVGSAVSAFRGIRQTGATRLAWLIPLLPLYWALMSFAAWQAAWQFIASPFTWEKTPHGLARDRRRAGATRT